MKGDVKFVDFCGNGFRTKTEMCKKYNIKRHTFNYRIKRGWSLKDALTIKAYSVQYGAKKPCQDFDGNWYSSVSEMCQKYGISPCLFYNRINKYGWSLKDTLTIPCGKKNHVSDKLKKKVTGPLGDEYDSITDMATKYGISYNLYTKRRSRGMSVADALQAPVKRRK